MRQNGTKLTKSTETFGDLTPSSDTSPRRKPTTFQLGRLRLGKVQEGKESATKKTLDLSEPEPSKLEGCWFAPRRSVGARCQAAECLSTPCQFCAILSHLLAVYDLVTLVDSLS